MKCQAAVGYSQQWSDIHLGVGGNSMNSNVRGRVRNTNLPKSHGLLPLLEAIINSVDAIEDIKEDISSGIIDVKILRSQKALELPNNASEDQQLRGPIFGFEVVDNGVGFTEANYQAFNEADTQYKENRGGKGVGRFL
jgi:hypothetical protein